jgi:hypothetical protein
MRWQQSAGSSRQMQLPQARPKYPGSDTVEEWPVGVSASSIDGGGPAGLAAVAWHSVQLAEALNDQRLHTVAAAELLEEATNIALEQGVRPDTVSVRCGPGSDRRRRQPVLTSGEWVMGLASQPATSPPPEEDEGASDGGPKRAVMPAETRRRTVGRSQVATKTMIRIFSQPPVETVWRMQRKTFTCRSWLDRMAWHFTYVHPSLHLSFPPNTRVGSRNVP